MCFMGGSSGGGTIQATAGTTAPENVESLTENRFRRRRLLNDGGTGPGGTGSGGNSGGLGGDGPGDSAAGDSTGPW